MKIKMNADGAIFEGSPVEIVDAMRYRTFFTQDQSIAEYIDWAVEQAEKFQGIKLDVAGDDDMAKAKSFIAAMITEGLAEKA